MVDINAVRPDAVFNLPLFEIYLVVDARSVEEYNKEHIVSSVSFPAPPVVTPDAMRLPELLVFLNQVVVNAPPELFTPIVFYGNENDPDGSFQAHVSWLASVINKMRGDNLALTVSASGTPSLGRKNQEVREGYNPAQNFCDSLVSKLKNLWIIEGGYPAFKRAYPFLCGNISVSDMKPLPHQIEDNLFLGSRAFSITPESLQQLGINYAIVNKAPDYTNPLSINNIMFLECDVADESTESMEGCWQSSIKFINSARAAGGKVLVQLWGRSRSASVVLAWLMASKGWSYEVAEQYLKSKCKSVDTTLVFKSQLKDFEAQGIKLLTNA